MDLSSINWLAVAVAALAFFGFGVLWYGPLFGKQWQQAVELVDEELKLGRAKLFGSGLVMALIISVGMAVIFYLFLEENERNTLNGALLGSSIGIFFLLPAITMNYIFARRPLGLVLIDGFYHVLAFTLVGLILGIWQSGI